MFCRKCGEENPDNAVFCRNCGERLNEEAKKTTVIEVENEKQESNQTSSSTGIKKDNDWMNCCICIVVVFIVFAIFGAIFRI